MSDGHPQGGVVFWDPAARRRSNPPVAVPEGVVEKLAFGPEGATLIVAYRSLFGESGGLLAYDVRGRRRLTEPPIAISEGSVVHLAISRDRRTLAVGYIGTRNRRESGVTIWDVTKLRDRAHLSLELAGGFNGKSAISPDGRTAAFERYPLVLWDLAAKPGPTRAALRPPGNWVEGLAFSPDGRTLASGYLVDFQQPRGGGVVLWDVATRRRRAEKPLLVPEAGQDSCVVTFSPDGATLTAGFKTAGVILWDVASGVRRTKKPIALSGVGALAFSPDGTTLAIGLRGFTPEAKNEVVLWDLTLGRPSERQPLAGLGRYVLCVRFSPDGTTLVAGFLGGKGAASGFAWGDLGAGGRPGAVIQPVRDGVYSLAFSPDGSILATGSSQYSGSSVQLWDVAARRQLLDQAIPIAGSLVSDVTFCAEGRLLAVCSYDQPSNRSRWTFWDVVPAAERARRAGEIANRNLSADEWSRSFPNYPYRPTFENLPGVKNVETSAGPGSSALR